MRLFSTALSFSTSVFCILLSFGGSVFVEHRALFFTRPKITIGNQASILKFSSHTSLYRISRKKRLNGEFSSCLHKFAVQSAHGTLKIHVTGSTPTRQPRYPRVRRSMIFRHPRISRRFRSLSGHRRPRSCRFPGRGSARGKP